MKRLQPTILADKPYWETLYSDEEVMAKRIVDSVRLRQVLDWSVLLSVEQGVPVRALDVGCGAGEMLRTWRSSPVAGHIAGFDVSEEALQRCARLHLKDCQLRQGLASKLPYQSSEFDIVYCGETLALMDDPDQVVSELKRVVRNYGLVCLSMPYRQKNRHGAHKWEFNETDAVGFCNAIGAMTYFNSYLIPNQISMFMVARKESS